MMRDAGLDVWLVWFVASVWAIVAKLQALDSRDRGASCWDVCRRSERVEKYEKRGYHEGLSARGGDRVRALTTAFCTWGPNVVLVWVFRHVRRQFNKQRPSRAAKVASSLTLCNGVRLKGKYAIYTSTRWGTVGTLLAGILSTSRLAADQHPMAKSPQSIGFTS